MGWLRERTRNTMTWLECYGIYREAGVNQYMTQEALDGNSEFVLSSQTDMQAGADTARAEQVAATQYAGEVLMAVGAIVLVAAGESIAGAVIGALVLAVGAILTFFADLFYVECDKYHCTGHDRNTATRINRYKEHVKAMVGVQGEDERSWDHKDDCGCDKRGHQCLFVKYMHDGLVIEGIDWDVIEGEPTTCGVIRGANAIPCKDRDTVDMLCAEFWRVKGNSTPLNPRTQKRIPRGGDNWPELFVGRKYEPRPVSKYAKENNLSARTSHKDVFVHEAKQNAELLTKRYSEKQIEEMVEKNKIRPFYKEMWRNKKNTYYFRAWRVQQVLYWMTGDQFIYNNILCRTMKCMEEVFAYTVAVGDDSGFDQRRRRGSRWYASIVWMMRDIWRAGQHLIRQARTREEGWTQFGQILQDSGASENALNELRKMAKGQKYTPRQTPWPFWPLMQYISFTTMREILINLKPHFPYVYQKPPGLPEPQGEEARSRMLINVPVLEPIAFDSDMQPIPAKMSSARPGLGTIMLGLGAAAVGTYALYKLLAPAEE